MFVDVHFPRIAKPSGPRLNIKTIFRGYGDFHVKDKTIPILVKHAYIETAPRGRGIDRVTYLDPCRARGKIPFFLKIFPNVLSKLFVWDFCRKVPHYGLDNFHINRCGVLWWVGCFFQKLDSGEVSMIVRIFVLHFIIVINQKYESLICAPCLAMFFLMLVGNIWHNKTRFWRHFDDCENICTSYYDHIQIGNMNLWYVLYFLRCSFGVGWNIWCNMIWYAMPCHDMT